MEGYTCVVIGDVNIDYFTDLSRFSLRDVDNACINSSIISNIGGNGTFFAEAALEAGFSSIKLICSLGSDIAAETVKSHFSKKDIELIIISSSNETGKVIIIYQPDDKRVMVADRGANATIFISVSCKIEDFIHLPTNLLYISGYSLLNDVSNITLSAIIEQYKTKGTFCIIDAVPHEIFHTYDWDKYVYDCRGLDGIIIELTTAFGFMKQNGFKENVDVVADFLLKSFRFCLVRLNAESDFLIADKTNRRVVRIYYQPRIASLRFTDRVISQIISRYIKNPSDIFTSSQWVHEINKMIGDKI